jgi:hypothetical protein
MSNTELLSRSSFSWRHPPPHSHGRPVKREWETSPSVGLHPGPQTPVE